MTLDYFDLISSPLLIGAFAVLVWLQWHHPLRTQRFHALRRTIRNLLLSLPAFLIARLALLPLPLGLAIFTERYHFRVLVTPRMHGIHRSIVERETNSNWGTVFVWWDWIHGTLRRDVPQAAITIGVPAYRDEKELTIGQLLVLPFRNQRPWQLPNGEIPDRPAQPTDELAP
jgi:hypothetical protein